MGGPAVRRRDPAWRLPGLGKSSAGGNLPPTGRGILPVLPRRLACERDGLRLAGCTSHEDASPSGSGATQRGSAGAVSTELERFYRAGPVLGRLPCLRRHPRGQEGLHRSQPAWCTGRADCALGADTGQAVNTFHALVRPLIIQPAAVSDGRKAHRQMFSRSSPASIIHPALTGTWRAMLMPNSAPSPHFSTMVSHLPRPLTMAGHLSSRAS